MKECNTKVVWCEVCKKPTKIRTTKFMDMVDFNHCPKCMTTLRITGTGVNVARAYGDHFEVKNIPKGSGI